METKETIRQSHEENQYGKMIVFDFGKNGLGITDELIAIGKKIQELSEENLVHLSSESFIDDADDVYTLKFYVTPKEAEDTMTAKREAEELIDKIIVHSCDYENAKQSSIIAVETIIQSGHLRLPEDRLYWKMVKHELTKLQ